LEEIPRFDFHFDPTSKLVKFESNDFTTAIYVSFLLVHSIIEREAAKVYTTCSAKLRMRSLEWMPLMD